jgi:hypothetical protein
VQQVQATEPLEPAENRAARSGHLLDASAAIFRFATFFFWLYDSIIFVL